MSCPYYKSNLKSTIYAGSRWTLSHLWLGLFVRKPALWHWWQQLHIGGVNIWSLSVLWRSVWITVETIADILFYCGKNAESFWGSFLMAKRMAASELLSSKPQATNSESDWLNHRKRKLRYWHWGSSLSVFWKACFSLAEENERKEPWKSRKNN